MDNMTTRKIALNVSTIVLVIRLPDS
uniref:Uncharacterized protein n=1 Tax=Anguilla anguilla TaxID=7936 RepID=A0A0E9TBZ6_ANGAN